MPKNARGFKSGELALLAILLLLRQIQAFLLSHFLIHSVHLLQSVKFS